MAEEIKADRKLDLRGEVCPYTVVKSKLALEAMEVGQVLEVLVDNEPATRNLPRNMTFEGQHLLRVEPIERKNRKKEWRILVRKDREPRSHGQAGVTQMGDDQAIILSSWRTRT